MSEKSEKKGAYLYLTIYEALKESIVSGKYRKGDTFPPERLLKDQYGTTHVTVRNALSLLVEEGYIERYSGKGTVVVYSGGSLSGPDKQSSTPNHLYFLISELTPYYSSVLKEINGYCSSKKISHSLNLYQGNTDLEGTYLRSILSRKDIILVYEPSSRQNLDIIPGSAVSRTILLNPSDTFAGFTSISQDLEKGARDCVDLMSRMGFRKVAFLGWERTSQGENLARGYRSGIAAGHLYESPDLYVNSMGLREAGYDACQRILKAHPDCRAFLCANDLAAGGVLNFLMDEGLLFSGDFSVIGCGNHPYSEIFGLSSIDLNARKTGQVLRSLLDEFEGTGSFPGSDFVIYPELVLRKHSLNY